ncbi:non-ribosomal peptide synthetase, partial [Marilutibacter spongiae]
ELEPLPEARVTSHFDLSLALHEDGDAIAGELEYASDLFEPATLRRWLGYFECMLGEMARDDQASIGALPMMDAVERDNILRGFNDTRRAWPTAMLVHRLFEAQAARVPTRTAILFEGRAVDYATLNGQANRLARRLRGAGVGPDCRVALCLRRGPAMVVGMLAVLKAGGAYVPLDPAHPPERLLHVLEDSAPVALLAESAVADVLVTLDGAGVPVIDIDELPSGDDAARDLDPADFGLEPGHLAYVIYTSGSTGRPKGVMVEHRQVVNLIHAHREICGLHEASRILQFATYAFDASVEEIFPGLAIGATLIVRPQELVAPDQSFVDLLDATQPDLVNLPTAFWHQWVQDVREGRMLPARWPGAVNVGGEKLERHHLEAWMRSPAGGRAAVLNTYGPTETTVNATSMWFDGIDALPARDVPIGRPIPNATAYVLDPMGQPVPVGVAGELHVGGAGVARGYLGRPEQSAERFVADPFAGEAGARMYRTGDLARWRADGTLEYLGRNDLQVKIRGFRIELGEIEVGLMDCAGVREAVVEARDTVAGKRLVGYVVPQAGAALSAATLRAALSARFSDYMVPSAIVQLEALPTTPNGKIDRKALPEPVQWSEASAWEAPEGEFETGIASTWARLLGCTRVGRDDHFFELGGHSLLATRVVGEVGRAFGRTVPLRMLFEQPGLRAFAAAVAALPHSGQARIPVVPRGDRLPLSFAQRRLWFIDRLEGGSAQYNMPIALRVQGVLDESRLGEALDRLVERHEALRTAFVEIEGEAWQRVQDSATVRIVRKDLRQLDAAAQASRIALEAEEEASAPFDLTRAPLVRCTLLQLSGRVHVVLFTMHHIVSDGWSTGILVRELGEFFAAGLQDRQPDLPPLPVQYVDYAAWQHGDAARGAFDESLAFWMRQLDRLPDLHALPLDKPRPTRQSYVASRLDRTLDADRLKALARLAESSGVTLFMLLQTAFAALLARWSGESDIVVGTPVAGREQVELESVIGFFNNTLACRFTVDDDTTLDALLAHGRRVALDALAHQRTPFELLVEQLRPARSLAYNPLCQIKFVLQNHESSALVLPGLQFEVLPHGADRVRFDLDLTAEEQADGLALAWTYKASLFEASSIERMARAYEALLAQWLERPQARLDELEWVDAAQSASLRALGRGADSRAGRAQPLPRALEAAAARTPNAPAVRCGGVTLDHRELDAKANRLAHALQEAGVQAGDRVGVHLERSVELMVALLACMKAGAAYVPLDHRQP